MKRFFRTAMAVLAGSVLMSSCAKEEIVTFNPEDVTPQTLGNISGCELSADGQAITTTYNFADFGVQAPVGYSLFVDASGNSFNTARKLNANFSDGKVSFTQKDLNNAILNLGGAADLGFEAEFKLVASLLNDKGSEIEGTGVSSNVVKAIFVPYDVEMLDVDVYDHVWIIGAGATVGAWSHDKVYQYLYDYNKDGATYTGLIYYGEDAASGWKLTGIAGWQDDCNWGSEAQAEDAEAGSILLISSGGSKDIKSYSKKFYMWNFNKSSLILTKEYGFDCMSIIGSFNEWQPLDDATVMNYNDYYHRFYIDYTMDADSELKFLADQDSGWALNFGEGCAQGGANIKVPAGSYRIYLDLNKGTYEFSTRMFGQQEPGAPDPGPEPDPEPDQYKGWGIIGDFNEWGGDAAMTEADGVWTGYVNLEAGKGFKLRKDAGWDENRGAAGEVEPFTVPVGEAFEAVAGGKNLTVPADGFYQVKYDANNETITVSNGEVWGVIGQFNNWGGDAFMTLTDGKWVSPAIALVGGEGFKIRYNAGWDVNRGAAGETEPFIVPVGTAFEAVAGGKNLAVEADGNYVVVYDPEAETITVNTALPSNTWSLIGVNGDWNNDIFMTEVEPGVWVSPATEMSGNFKVRFNHGWDVNRGGDPIEMGKAVKAVADGANFEIAEAGTYAVVYDANKELVYFLGWSVIGNVAESGWSKDYPMLPSDGRWWAALVKVDEGLEFKIRYTSNWDVNFGGVLVETAVPFEAVSGGANIKVPAAGWYEVIYDSAAGTITVCDAGWGLIGVNGNWDNDIVMHEFEHGKFEASATFSGEFKLRYARGWDVNRGGEFAALGTPIAVAANGANIKVAGEPALYKVVYDSAAETVTVSGIE